MIDTYLSGEKLYGDDFGPEEIRRWFEDEKEGYADLGARDLDEHEYGYHALNVAHGFSKIESASRFRNVLGFGSCYGGEFEPIADRVDQLTIIDPSDAFVRDNVFGIPCRYMKPLESGELPFEDGTFDLITCFGVLHHIPNVSDVVGEIARVLAPGGHALIREPIVSMGDWRYPRAGLTKHERGIPVGIFRRIVEDAGLVPMHVGYCIFRPIPKFGDKLQVSVYNHQGLVKLDAWICELLSKRIRYHATNVFEKFRPESAYFTLRKPLPG